MSVTFTRTSQSEDASGVLTPTVTTITGSAIRVRGNPQTLRALSLINSEAPTLLFTATTYGQRPQSGDTVVWESLTWVVRDVDPVAPDGVSIVDRVIITR